VWSDDITLRHLRRCAKIFEAFRAYRRSLMAISGRRGWPLLRHPVLHYPNDPVLVADVARTDGGTGRIRQFLLGSDYMIIPVLQAGMEHVRGYLPRGRWLRLWHTGEGNATFELTHGRWLSIHAPIGRPAVFARAEAASLASIKLALRKAGVL
ncbi:MAG: hypothetical protein SGPRY_010459, partial [Prymnesium sp.]